MPGPGGSGYNRYREMTLEEMLLENRVIFLVGEINHVSAARVYMQMLYLQSQKRDADITLYINSPGGVVSAGFAIYDTMAYLTCDVATVCIGQAASMSAFLLAAGTKGKRFALPHARVLLHQPWGGVEGQASDIELQAKEILRMRDLLTGILAADTGQAVEKVSKDTDRDYILTAGEAVEYGVIDEVINTRDLVPLEALGAA